MRPAVTLKLALLVPFLAACAGGPGGGDAPVVLAHQVPGEPQVTYTQADTAVIAIDAGGQMFDVNMVSNSVMDMAFEASEVGVRVNTTWRELDAFVSNPMGAPERFDTDDIEGALVFDLTPRGQAEVVAVPALSAGALQMVSPSAVANGFFPRLPGTPPTTGMSWTDTIAFEAEEGPGSTVSRTIMTYTVVGDTTVAGRTMVKVDMAGDMTQTAEGVTSGMGFVQDLSGAVTGFFVWDLRGQVMHSQYSESDLVGTMDVDAAPFPLDIVVRGVSRVNRQAN